MRVKILGSAAGGGFPQWNCACSNCLRVRSGTLRAKLRTQTQIALALNEGRWCLLSASPDLRAQILATPELQPNNGARDSPIAAVVLTSADVDQVAGLLHLREFQPLRIYATGSIVRILREDNSIFCALEQSPGQISWRTIRPGEKFELEATGNPAGAIRCEPFSLPGDFPAYVSPDRRRESTGAEAVLGLCVESATGKRLIYMPGVAYLENSWLPRLEECDVLLFDGTYWDEDELVRVRGGGRRATEMGHMPISGADGSLRKLSHLRRPRKIYIHINNTNPILNEEGLEHRLVTAAGWEIAEDGWEIVA